MGEPLEILKRAEDKIDGIIKIAKTISSVADNILQVIDPQPQTYKIYKGMGGKNGALQIDLTPVHRSQRDLGAMFIQAAPTIGLNEYDWDHKIIMGIGLADIEKLLAAIETKQSIQIFHDPKAGEPGAHKTSKILMLSKLDYGWMVGLKHTMGDTEHKAKLPVSDGEMLIIKTLLERAVTRILGW